MRFCLWQVWKSSSIWGNYSELLRTWPTPVRLLVAEARLPGTSARCIPLSGTAFELG